MPEGFSDSLYQEVSSIARSFNSLAHLSESDTEFRHSPATPEVAHDLINALFMVPCKNQREFIEKAIDLAIDLRVDVE